MDLMEYKAKGLFEACGIPIMPGLTIASLEELDSGMASLPFPAVAKAQVGAGKRGKAGGIVKAGDASSLRAACESLLTMQIGGLPVRRVMIVPYVKIEQEYYMAVMLDRNAKGHRLIFSPCGGMDIEEAARSHPEKVVNIEMKPSLGLLKPAVRYALKKTGASADHWAGLEAAAEGLYRCAMEFDCTLAEINPLAAVAGGGMLALDAKAAVDDSALPRHPDLLAWRDEVEENARILEARKFRFLYIPCEADGDVVVMSNGSGMLMSCIDLLAKNGMKTLAVLDLGGGATRERIKEAVRILSGAPGAKTVFINIFGGITRCDEVALGIRDAIAEYGVTQPVVARLEGTNKQTGIEALTSLPQVAFAEDLASGVAAVKERSGRK